VSAALFVEFVTCVDIIPALSSVFSLQCVAYEAAYINNYIFILCAKAAVIIRKKDTCNACFSGSFY